MKTINNQWQLSSAIYLLIITLLTPLLPTALKLAVTVQSQAYSMHIFETTDYGFTFLYSLRALYISDSVRTCAQVIDKLRAPTNIYAASLSSYLHLHCLYFSILSHNFMPREGRIHWDVYFAQTHAQWYNYKNILGMYCSSHTTVSV